LHFHSSPISSDAVAFDIIVVLDICRIHAAEKIIDLI
jgi:hypothetical protein